MTGAGGDQSTSQPSPEDIVQMYPAIAESIKDAARRNGTTPADMQATFWRQALESP